MRLATALLIPALTLTLAAQTTGTLSGKVTNSKGEPLAEVTVTLSRTNISWSKTLKTGKDGKFLQVGLDPKEFELTFSKEGYVDTKFVQKVNLGPNPKDVTLLTPDEARKQAGAGTAPVAGAAEESAGLEAYNTAIPLFQEQKYTESLPLLEKAYASIQEALAKSTDAKVKEEIEKKAQSVTRVYTFNLAEVAKTDETRRAELYAKAEPLLLKLHEKDPKDQNALIYLLEVAKFNKDAAGEAKYQAALDAILGPNPKIAYNQGVEAFNAGKTKEAERFFNKAIGIDPKYGDPYYLLAMCEFANNNLKAVKANLLKYIELNPSGKDVETAKAMLSDPSLKNIK